MLRLGVVLSLVFAVIGFPQGGFVPRLDGRIVGGEDADITDYPYMVAVDYTGIINCGGSIIDTRWIVTAAHCVDSRIPKPSLLTVRAGSAIADTGGQVLTIANIIKHPSYSSVTLDYDIALLELSEDIILTNSSAIISMPQQGDDVDKGNVSLVTGWGSLGEDDDSSANLQVVEVPIVERVECNEMYQKIGRTVSERMICIGILDGGAKGTCHGDSGGPLTVNGILFGVVSFSMGCARADFPGVCANVASVRDWIFETSGV